MTTITMVIIPTLVMVIIMTLRMIAKKKMSIMIIIIMW
jgi:hypothetical protein